MKCLTRSAVCVKCLTLVLVLLGLSTHAQEEPVPATANGALDRQPLIFRREYIPADRIDDFARGTSPLRREQFEEMVTALKGDPNSVQVGTVESCLIAARLQGGALVGLGQMEIRQGRESNSYLSLAPCQLPINSAWWIEDFAEIPLGYDPRGDMGALIDRGGICQFVWALTGDDVQRGVTEFQVAMPAGPFQKMLLVVPEGHRLSVSSGMVQRATEFELASWSWWNDTVDEGDDAYLLTLKGSQSVTLRLEESVNESLSGQVSYRQSSVTELSHRETGLTTSFEINMGLERLRKVAVSWPVDFRLESVESDSVSLAWEATESIDETRSRAAILLPPEIVATNVPISLRLRGPPLPSDGHPLPVVRIHGLRWHEGTGNVVVKTPLRLAGVTVAEAELLPLTSPTSTAGDQRFAVRLFSENATIKVDTHVPDARLRARTAALFDFADQGVRGEFLAHLSCEHDTVFQFSASLGNQWTIDSLEATSEVDSTGEVTDLLRDWAITKKQAAQQTIEVRLKKPLTGSRALLLRVIVSRRGESLEGEVALDQLRPLTVNAMTDRHLFAFRAESSRQLRLISPDFARLIEADEFAAEMTDIGHFDDSWVSDSLRLGSQTMLPNIRFDLRNAKPRFAASIESQVHVALDSLAERHRIVCTPQSGTLDRLVVRIGSKSKQPPDWSIEGDKNVSITPRMLHDDLEGTLWELAIYPPRSRAFSLVARRMVPRNDSQRIGLLSLPDAATETGSVAVVATSPLATYQLQSSGLSLSPAAGEQPGKLSARFRYVAGEARSLRIVSEESLVAADAYQNWLTQLDTIATTQSVRHVARLHIENRGAEQLRVTLPEHVVLNRVLLDGEEVSDVSVKDRVNVELNLTAGKRFVLVTLEYEEANHRPWALWQRLHLRLPQTDRPALRSQWQVSTAPGIALWSEADLDSLGNEVNWPVKLFGVLATGFGDIEAATSSEASPAASGPWAQNDHALTTGIGSHWGSSEIVIRHSEPNHITLTNPRSWHVLAIGFVFLSAALTLLVCRNRVSRIVPMLGGTAALCLLAAGMCSVAASGLFLGTLLSTVWLGFARLGRPIAVEYVPQPSNEASTASVANASFLILIAVTSAAALLIGGDSLSQGQQPEADAPSVFRVFIPVDEQNQPQGDYVHLGDEFYRALNRRYSQQRWPAIAWMLHSANYAVTIEAKENDDAQYGSAVNVGQVRFEGDLSILRGDRSIALPFNRSQVELVEGTALLDGLPVEAAWNTSGTALVITPRRMGRFQLELAFDPQVAVDSGRDCIELSVPPAAHARLEVDHSANIDEFQLASREPFSQMTAERSVAELGPISTWKLKLPSYAELTRSLAVEQLTWLQLRPSALVWNAKFSYTPTSDPVRWLEWEVDPGLRPLAVTTEGAEFGRSTFYEERGRFRVELIEPVNEPFTVHASFIERDTSGVGMVRQPLLKPVGAQRDRHWLAVTYDRSVNARIEHGSMVEPLASGEYRTAWDEETALPTRAFRLLTPEPEWSVMVSPAVPAAAVDTMTALTIDRSAQLIKYRADVSKSDRAAWLYQIELPVGYRLQSAVVDSLRQSFKIVPTVEGERATIMLPQPLAEAHRISLTLLGPPPAKSFALPEISLVGIDERSSHYEIFRNDPVAVDVVGIDPVDVALQPSGIGPAWARLTHSIQRSSDSSVQWPPTVKVTPNRAKIEAYQLALALFRESDAWKLRIVAQGNVHSGAVDSLRFAVRDALPSPTLVSPSGKLQQIDLPAEAVTHWVVRPAVPLSGDFQIEIDVPLEFEPGQAPALPEIEPIGEQPQVTYVVLPRTIGQAESNWSVVNLEAIEPPVSMLTTVGVSSPVNAFRANPDYSARLSLAAPNTLEPQVRLADVRIVAQANRQYFGSISYDLEPGGLDFCELQVPPGVMVQRVLLDEAAVAVSQRTDGASQTKTYQCMLGETNLPRRLEVLFAGTSSDEHFRLVVPTLAEIPVERTLWTIHTPEGTTFPASDSSTQPIDRQRHLAFRLQAVATLAEPPENLLASISKADLNAWYLPWATRMGESFRAGSQVADRIEPADYPFNNDFAKERLEMAKRMGVAASYRAAFKSPAVAASWTLPKIVTTVDATPRQPTFAMSQGAPEPVELIIAERPDNGWWHTAAALVLVIGSIVGYRLVRGQSYSELIVWWLHPLGVVLGIAWWLWLTPALIGWIIVAIALLGSLRSPWRTQSFD